MSTSLLTQSRGIPRNSARQEPPPLATGDQLSRAEFERRYLVHPEIKKAELIEGIVYMPSPVKYERHATPHLALGGWLVAYMAATPGIEGGDNATLRLDNENEPQPDLLLRIDRKRGGRSFVGADDYLEGAPELIIEVAASTANYDMHVKKRAYARNGVQEYLVVLTYDRLLHWFVLRNGEYVDLAPPDDGVLRSEIFPGLWLSVAAFWANDLGAMLAVLQQGIATPEHAALVERLTT